MLKVKPLAVGARAVSILAAVGSGGYKISRAAFSPGQAYTAAGGGPFVGALDMTSGIVTPVVTGPSGPGGMQFVDTSVHHDGNRQDWRDDHCGGDQDD